jgi:hypothetical protein
MFFSRNRIKLKENLLYKWLTFKERILSVIYPAHQRILCICFSPDLVDTDQAEMQAVKILAKPG